MERTLEACIVVLLSVCSVCLVSCGGVNQGSTSRTTSTAVATGSTVATALPATATSPGQSSGSHDKHGAKVILDYGHAANATDARTITTLVKRYYAAAAADDGTVACALIFSVFKTAIPEDYGQSPGPPSLRGKTCAVVMSKLFKQRHAQLAGEVATLAVTGVRIHGARAYALLRFGTTSEPRYIPVQLEAGTWKIYALSDREIA